MPDNSQCETCQRRFGSQQAAAQHMDSVNHWSPRLEYDIDERRSLVQRLADLYIRTDSEELSETTTPRSDTVTASSQLQNRMPTQPLEDKQNRQPQVQCNICTKAFLTKRSLDQHRENTGHQEPRFKCDTCDGNFTSQSAVNQHMDAKSHHKRYNCLGCKKEFKSENALDMHVSMISHHEEKVTHPSPSQEHTTKSNPQYSQNEIPRKPMQSAPGIPQQNNPNVRQTTSPSQMYPHLHPHIATALAQHAIPTHFHPTNSDKGRTDDYSTNISGTFTCENKYCARRIWGSGKVAIKIRRYRDNKYNAEVYNQRCQACKKIGTLRLDEQSYVDRVSYRLKKWAGVRVTAPPYDAKETPPHRRELCEGCRAGVCEIGSRWY